MPKTKNSMRQRKTKPIPASESDKDLDEYFSKHSLEELDQAGLAKELSKDEKKWLNKLTHSIKAKVEERKSRSQLNLAFPEPSLSKFIKYAQKKHIPASTLARAWILERLDQELRQGR